jgi:hypothetical protein
MRKATYCPIGLETGKAVLRLGGRGKWRMASSALDVTAATAPDGSRWPPDGRRWTRVVLVAQARCCTCAKWIVGPMDCCARCVGAWREVQATTATSVQFAHTGTLQVRHSSFGVALQTVPVPWGGGVQVGNLGTWVVTVVVALVAEAGD